MVKVALVAPAATVTLAGTCAAAVLLLDSVTIAPPAGAAPLRVTVPVELVPPTTDAGDLVTDDNEAVVTVNVAFALPPSVAVTTDVVVEATLRLVTVNVPVVFPAATVTLAGTVAAAVLLLVSATEAPPVGAAALSVTVPVELAPPTTLVGLSDTLETLTLTAGLTVRVALTVAP
jgi:hypothetical protein